MPINSMDELNKQQSALTQTTEPLFESFFEHNPGMAALIDVSGRISRVNEKMVEVLGYTYEELNGTFLSELVCEEFKVKTERVFNDLIKGEPQTLETTVLNKKGHRLIVDITFIPIRIENNLIGCVALCVEITERKLSDQRIRYLAYYDDSTGLPNRRLFRERLEQIMNEGPAAYNKLAVFFVDIDKLKLVNESLGHDYGDILLLKAAERLTRCITVTDFLARTDGDKFAIFFTTESDTVDIDSKMERITKVFEEPFHLGPYPIHVTVSMGIAVYIKDMTDSDNLMKCAEIALSRAKEAGRNSRKIYNSDMKSYSLNRLKLENDLRTALHEKQFFLMYQPQLDTSTGDIVGLEALVRWRHPSKGTVPPKKFIPLAEETGLILPIGEWVLYEACRQNKQWQDAGLPAVPVSVNLSIRQFLQPDIRERIAEVLEKTMLDPEYLELELTESMTMDVDYASGLLKDLRALGVKISIDDFGTGYSSLSYLKSFPIDKLKIDRSFVRDIMLDPNDAAIVTTIITMARNLGIEVIAEGVETLEQLNYLHENDCRQIQGYWFSPPLGDEEISKLLTDRN